MPTINTFKWWSVPKSPHSFLSFSLQFFMNEFFKTFFSKKKRRMKFISFCVVAVRFGRVMCMSHSLYKWMMYETQNRNNGISKFPLHSFIHSYIFLSISFIKSFHIILYILCIKNVKQQQQRASEDDHKFNGVQTHFWYAEMLLEMNKGLMTLRLKVFPLKKDLDYPKILNKSLMPHSSKNTVLKNFLALL